MAANRESIFQPHSFTPSINNCDVAAFRLSKIRDAEQKLCVQPPLCVCVCVCVCTADVCRVVCECVQLLEMSR